ncbi:Hypothetical protein EAG7_01105 [Klebsiella aerogenes]|nr:Hypothetical protein EAG7_01105 [Klebsiella aerogenes]CCG29614.1 hypothetical protein [Klebsiella aerogenes EA1509E]
MKVAEQSRQPGVLNKPCQQGKQEYGKQQFIACRVTASFA